MTPSADTKQRGKIEAVDITNNHGHHSVLVHFEFEGSVQAFGGLALGSVEEETSPILDNYVASLCAVFGVTALDQLVGKECYALRCFDRWNDPIEGLETLSGFRFTHTAWRRKYFGKAETPLDAKIKEIQSTIEWAERRKKDALADLETVRRRYVAWE